jgi:hypothetical protein
MVGTAGAYQAGMEAFNKSILVTYNNMLSSSQVLYNYGINDQNCSGAKWAHTKSPHAINTVKWKCYNG